MRTPARELPETPAVWHAETHSSLADIAFGQLSLHSLPDATGGVPLLTRSFLVCFQNLIDEHDWSVQFRAAAHHFLPWLGQGAANRLPHHSTMYIQLPGDSGNGSDAKIMFSSDLLEKLHFDFPFQRVALCLGLAPESRVSFV